jgi:hypothetical protein
MSIYGSEANLERWYRDHERERAAEKSLYAVKCDDCKVTVRLTTDIRESYAGTICKTCNA